MSAGVTEQRLKGQGSQGKVEERSIPWSQQVDEALFEVTPPPTELNQQNQGTIQSGTQFQYPPFVSRDENNSSQNYERGNTKRNNVSQQQSYEFSSKNENGSSGNPKMHSSMNYSHNKRTNNYDPNYKPLRNDSYRATNGNSKRGLQNLSIGNHEISISNKSYNATNEEKSDKTNSFSKNVSKTTFENESQPSSNIKQTTWASIASQPAKPTVRSTLISTTIKKKGPGMPPPPMVPGKHNMDINTWDTPKNGPVLVPPPIPPVPAAPLMEKPYEQSKSKSNESSSSNVENNNENTFPKARSNEQIKYENRYPNNWAGSNHSNNKPFERNNQYHQNAKGRNDASIKPPWVPQLQKQENLLNQSEQHQSNYHSLSNPGSNSHAKGDNKASTSHFKRPDSGIKFQPQLQNDTQTTTIRPSSPTPSNSSSTAIKNREKKDYNPQELNIEKARLARFFVIKSYSEDDIYRSIKYKIWCSTDHGNRRLDEAFRERQRENGFIYLLFSVNGSGHFCGIAQMMTPVDYDSVSTVWSQNKWIGTFKVKWLYIKDVPNALFRHIKIEANENKPVTNSRDTQEVPNDKGIHIMKIIHEFKHTTSLIEDFPHYEKRQEQEKGIKKQELPTNVGGGPNNGSRSFHRGGGIGGGNDYSRGDAYENGKNSGYYRDRKSGYNRGGFQNSLDNRRINDSRTLQESGNSPNNYNNNRDNNCGDCYSSNSKTNSFRYNFNRRGDERNYENVDSGESRGSLQRSGNRSLGSNFREREHENFKRKGGGWRTNQRSADIDEKAENK